MLIFDRLMLVSEGASESGPDVDKRFRAAYEYFNIRQNKKIKNMLVLGTGGGNIIRIFKEFYPDMAVDAVDIDPLMIEIGIKYFGLDTYTSSEYIISDAKLFVRNARKKKKKYDVIFIDLYLGYEIPDFILTEDFFRNVYALLLPRGIVFINHSYYGKTIPKAKQLLKLLPTIFSNVRSYAIDDNIEILASKI